MKTTATLSKLMVLLFVFAMELNNISFAQPLELASPTSLYAEHTDSKHGPFHAPETVFLSFKATVEEDHIGFRWTMIPNSDLAFITLEKSKNRRHFVKVLTIDGHEAFEPSKFYSTKDNMHSKKVTYYRLKATDRYGDCSYSSIVILKIRKPRATAGSGLALNQ